jgi:hypothetical protein
MLEKFLGKPICRWPFMDSVRAVLFHSTHRFLGKFILSQIKATAMQIALHPKPPKEPSVAASVQSPEQEDLGAPTLQFSPFDLPPLP